MTRDYYAAAIDLHEWLLGGPVHYGSFERATTLWDAVRETSHRATRYVVRASGGVYLDAGIGPSASIEPSACARVVGVGDCLAHVTRAATAISATLGRLEELPFASKTFDGAVCVDTLYQVEAKDRALGELARVLRAGGRLLITDVYAGVRRTGEVESVALSFGAHQGGAQLVPFSRAVTIAHTAGLEVITQEDRSDWMRRTYDASIDKLTRETAPVSHSLVSAAIDGFRKARELVMLGKVCWIWAIFERR